MKTSTACDEKNPVNFWAERMSLGLGEITSALLAYQFEHPSASSPAEAVNAWLVGVVGAALGKGQMGALPLLDAVSLSPVDAARAATDAYKDYVKGASEPRAALSPRRPVWQSDASPRRQPRSCI